MWWEILPSAGIICFCVSFPLYATYGTHKLILGKWCKRPRTDKFDKDLFDRDEDLTGWPYNTRGLDAIPDVPGQKFDFHTKQH